MSDELEDELNSGLLPENPQEDLENLQEQYIFASRDRDSTETGYLSRLLEDIKITAQKVKDTGGVVELSDDFKYVMKEEAFLKSLEPKKDPNFQYGPDGTSFPKAWTKEQVDNWYEHHKGLGSYQVLEPNFREPCFLKISFSNLFKVTTVDVFDKQELMKFNAPYHTFTISGDIDATKDLIRKTILSLQETEGKDIFIHDFTRDFVKFIKAFNENGPTPISGPLEIINDHINNNSTVQPNGSLRVTGWSEINKKLKEKNLEKNNAFEAKLLEIVEQSQNTPLKRGNINSKEKIMSDEKNVFRPSTETDPNEIAFRNALHQRGTIAGALKDGTLSCLPGADGFADTSPAINAMDGDFYHGANLLYIKEHQKQHGFPTGEYITAHQIEKAGKDNPDIALQKDQKGVTIQWNEKNKDDQWEKKSALLYNVAQTTNPQELKNWIIEQEQKKIDRMKEQFGESYKPAEPKPEQKKPGPTIECTSTDPEKYLGQYLAAVSMGGKFKASPEQAKEFAQKTEASLFEKMDNGHTNPFQLSKISNAANEYCKEVVREVKIQTQKQNQPAQEQQQSRGGRGM
jgi:hypothetical protein